uniref:AlNc14C43G3568 protein n=1 Tax=Albugo laibachii Nc14 TaxID=890382 RepID=F0WA24_9STRA|nr:AlNc14C43G3568 [Albugo laibachii Nc14]|eukprot:CCA17994.1 AlNc14C43G3568 [Albugo laibachii Nc14]
MSVDPYLAPASAICWQHVSTDTSQRAAFSGDKLNASQVKGSSPSCPVSIHFLDLKSSRRAEEDSRITWMISPVNNVANTSVEHPGLDQQEDVMTGTLYICSLNNNDHMACDGNNRLIYNTTKVAHVPLKNGSVSHLSAQVNLQSPGTYGVYAGIHFPLSDLVTQHALSSPQTFTVREAASDENSVAYLANRTNHSGVMIACVVLAVNLVMLLGLAIYLCKRRARVESKRSTVTTVLHDPPPAHHTNWSEVYANDEPLPSSILIDDTSTLAIMRASRLSSPLATKKMFDSPWDMQMCSLSPENGFYSSEFTSWHQRTSQIAEFSLELSPAEPTLSQTHERSHSSSFLI